MASSIIPVTESFEVDVAPDATGDIFTFGSTISDGFFRNDGAVEVEVYLNLTEAVPGKALRIPAGAVVDTAGYSFKRFFYKTASGTGSLKGFFIG